MHDVIPPSNQCLLIVINQLPVLRACILQLELRTVVGFKAPKTVKGTVKDIAEVGGADPCGICNKSAFLRICPNWQIDEFAVLSFQAENHIVGVVR